MMIASREFLKFQFYWSKVSKRLFCNEPQPHICIVGSGPSGFVIAQTLLKNHSRLKVDIFEKSPVPFGLIRYGVSPDHQDVKNCINGYNKTALSNRFSYFGNVDITKDVSLTELCQAYHAVVLCSGAQTEQKLGVPGENLNNVFTSNQFVGWYNGVPQYQNLNIDLSGKTAVVVGVGNVALDAVRMLCKSTEDLANTDITTEAIEKLSSCQIKNVHLVGRRGPLQMACTRKELSEITDLPDVSTFIEQEHYSEVLQAALKKKDLKRRKQQRLISYLQKVANWRDFDEKSLPQKKIFFVDFLRNPIEICASKNNQVSSIKFRKFVMSGDDPYNPIISSTDTVEEIKCDLIITCIGYKNVPIDESLIPFKDGKIIQTNGCIDIKNGLYACGWCCHGPKGVLADSGNDSLVVGSSILSDLNTLLSTKGYCGGSDEILETLKKKGIRHVTWDQWQIIDKYEVLLGEKVGKVRQKILTTEKMLSCAFNELPRD